MSVHSRLDSIAKDAAMAGIFKTKGEIVNGRPVVSWVVTCGQCGCQHKAAWSPDMGPEIMLKLMKGKHWFVGHGKVPKCPTCCAAPKKGPQLVTMDRNIEAQGLVTPNASVNPAPKIVRAVYGLLEDHFMEGPRRYHPGWDDAKVAKEAGTSTQAVAKLREDAFGKLAEDPRLMPLREDIDLQRMLIEDFMKETSRKLHELTERIAKVAG